MDPAAAIDGLLVQVNANNTNKQFAIVKYIILLCELFFFYICLLFATFIISINWRSEIVYDLLTYIKNNNNNFNMSTYLGKALMF